MCTVDPNRTVSEEKNVCVNCGCVQCMERYTILMQEGSSFIVTVPEDGELGVFNPRYTYVTLNEGVAAKLGMMPQYRYAGPIRLARDSAKNSAKYTAGYIYFFCPDTPYGVAVGVQEYQRSET